MDLHWRDLREINIDHIKELLAWGAKPEDIPDMLREEMYYGCDFVLSLQMEEEHPDEVTAIHDINASSVGKFDDLEEDPDDPFPTVYPEEDEELISQCQSWLAEMVMYEAIRNKYLHWRDVRII